MTIYTVNATLYVVFHYYIFMECETMDVFDLLPKLIRASLEYDRKTTESIALMIAKKVKRERPEISTEISKALSYSGYENSLARSIDMQSLPVDKESRNS